MTGRLSRVAITTTEDRARPLAEHSRRLGMAPVLLPCIRVTPAPPESLGRIREMARRADWIILTSPRPVAMLWPEGAMPAVPVAAVGPATARAVAAAGGNVQVTGDQGGAALMQRLGSQLAGRRVAYPHAGGPALDLTASLQAAGATVEEGVVYLTEEVGPSTDPVDAVLFGSPSAVRGWGRTRSLDGLVVAVTGPTTAAAVREAGHSHPLQSKPAGFRSALAVLAASLSKEETSHE